jgi:outer membrane receptor protein involved in Fe transport
VGREAGPPGERGSLRPPHAPGGTPGWSVANLRASWDAGPLRLRAGVENVFDAAYRTHGSGVDGVGRALWAAVEAGF